MSEIQLLPNEREIDAVRTRIQNARGRQFWRSLDELADTPAFQAWLNREFPRGAAEMVDPVTRRTFLKLMGASLALAGLSGCTTAMRQPQEKVAPFARAPIDQTPGIPLFYATALSLDGYGLGVAVRSNDGRPTKIEGNPGHPASLGATDVFAQAEILALYDPDRPETLINRGVLRTWDSFTAAFNEILQVQRALNGAGLRIVTPTITSPTLAAQLQELLATFSAARWIQYDPVGRNQTYAGAQIAFGEYVETRYRFDAAEVILALDADFLSEGPGRVRYARDFMGKRRVREGEAAMSRLYAIEPILTNTGIVADHRLPLKPGLIGAAAARVAEALGAPVSVNAVGDLPETAREWLDVAIADLRAAGSQGLVIAGEGQPPEVHALVHAINAALGAVGTTLEYTDPVAAVPSDQHAALRELVSDLNANEVEVLVFIDSNPAYSAPADIDVAGAMANAGVTVAMNAYQDETAILCDWFVPLAHPLESWGDVRAYDGSVTIVQPLIEPLYGARNPHELIALMLGQVGTSAYDALRSYWQAERDLADDAFETFFNAALYNGIISDTQFAARDVALQPGLQLALPAAGDTLELIFRPDPTIWDGRYANNGWLQELPKPTTKLTWDNAALMSPRTAIRLLNLDFDPAQLAAEDSRESQFALERLAQANGSLVEIQLDGRSLSIPVWMVPGHAEDTVTISLGYGRSRAGRVGDETGFNAYLLRTSNAPWFAAGATVTPQRGSYQLVSTQDHWTLEGRDIVRVGEIAAFQADPGYLKREIYEKKYGEEKPHYESLLPDVDYSTGNQWGMTIDLNACTGCNACTIACQAENNIPIVGKAEVAVGREMHWIRIDRYFAGTDLDNPETYVMPMACVHCEKAPCELVCPVNATVHDAEGLNNMIYNRCVGTKYCSNNCPYKVRRFNFLQYNDNNEGSLKLMRNPEVTVRNRGVMEKCSYCVQRISAARIQAKVEGQRPIADGEIITACQQVCPTQAIVFGDINDPQSRVTQAKAQPHNYTVLDELNVKPRTSYLARMRNSNEALAAAEPHEG
jgi:MoCo/4Fe-4S cofactor protein with predicted Tat translocation signal